MEETGLYSVAVAKVLYGLKANFVVENALRIKRSSGIIRGKTDREDAIMIATYASKHYQELKLWRPKRGVLEELKYLMTLRNRLLATGIALSNPMKEQDVYVAPGVLRTLKGLCHQTMDALEADKAEVESAINRLVAGDARIKRLFEVVTSVGNIGRITAIYIILSTNEFLDISCPKKFACYCGVAPFKRESGTMRKRPRVSRVGNRNMKALLHMCAMGAVLRNPELRRFFERKTKVDGKPKMAVINAVRYKLILRVFACVRQDRLYVEEYNRPASIPDEPVRLVGDNLKSLEIRT
jgi:transposase